MKLDWKSYGTKFNLKMFICIWYNRRWTYVVNFIYNAWKWIKIFPCISKKLDCEKDVYELGNHVGKKHWIWPCHQSLALWTKLLLQVFFSNCMLENTWIKSAFPYYALLPRHKGAKRNTIGVIIGINVKVPHHNYLTENEMPLVCHLNLWWHMIK